MNSICRKEPEDDPQGRNMLLENSYINKGIILLCVTEDYN
jgi:hypothetical protein